MTLSQKIFRQYLPAALGILLMLLVAVSMRALSAHADDASSTPDQTQLAPDTSSDTSDTDATTPDDSNTPDTPPADPGSDASSTPTDATSTPGQGGDATINTGDADSNADLENGVNTNDASTTAQGGSQAQNASTTIDDTNDAGVGNTASSDADSGDNTASTTNPTATSTPAGNATVTTGDALSTANVINVVNTNLIGSQGLLEFLNEFFGGGLNLDNLDLSYFFGGSDPSGCSLSSCGGSLNVSNNNDATLNNNVTVTANSGGNTATSDGEGNATITTGNAAASANVVNVVNTNIVDSHYLLLAFNNFGDLAGDITLPGASFFEQLLAGQGGASGNTSVTNNNSADITNNNSADADSGSNTASTTGSGDASVTTGDATAGATTVNNVNTNMVGGATVFMLVNIFGNWTGSVQGLPPGISWAQTPTGIMLTGGSLGTLTDPNSTPSTNDDSSTGPTLNASSTNTASILNNVQAYALTGSNYAGAENGNASVDTGNAYASSDVLNIVNTNILGQNWIFAIFNIFGNWAGNLTFGEPDLWIGAVAQTPNPTPPGSQVTYQFTVSNRGDADATNVVLNASFDTSMLTFDNPDATSSDGVSFNLGTIPQGATETYTYTATAGMTGTTVVPVPLTATVSEDETDSDPSDNTDQVTILVGNALPGPVGSASAGESVIAPQISMTKLVSADGLASSTTATTTAPGTAHYEVDINDAGGPAYNTELVDTLTDPSGNTVYTRSFNVGEIDPGSAVKLTYDIQFPDTATPGIYTNTAKLTGQEGNSSWQYAFNMTPVEASATVDVEPGQVLGAETDIPDCDQFLTAYIKPGAQNNSQQVKLLQYFLNNFEGDKNVQQTGSYDSTTVAAVDQFQQKYASDVLTPWGENAPTGIVFYTTEKEINNLYCQGRAQFPLSDAQMQYISSHHGSGSNAPVLSVSKGKNSSNHSSNDSGAGSRQGVVLGSSTVNLGAAASAAQSTTSNVAHTITHTVTSLFSKFGGIFGRF